MQLPKTVAALVNAQERFDSVAYANCFAETAIIVDEGHTYTGRKEIERWVADTNQQFNTMMKPVSYEEKGATGVLKAEVSGTFPGSPVLLNYHLEMTAGLIQLLRITG